MPRASEKERDLNRLLQPQLTLLGYARIVSLDQCPRWLEPFGSRRTSSTANTNSGLKYRGFSDREADNAINLGAAHIVPITPCKALES